MVGLYKYDATTEEELSFEEGDTLTLYEQDDPDWFLVGNGTHVGFVPGNYIEVITYMEPFLYPDSTLLFSNPPSLINSLYVALLCFNHSYRTWITRLLQDRPDMQRQSNHKSNTRKKTQPSRITTMNRNKQSQ